MQRAFLFGFTEKSKILIGVAPIQAQDMNIPLACVEECVEQLPRFATFTLHFRQGQLTHGTRLPPPPRCSGEASG